MRALALFLLLLLATACNAAEPTVVIGGKTFTLEVAATDAQRAQGLMNRESLPADRGMIFVFPYASQHRFWMKNTKIPLDLLYLDKHGKIVNLVTLQPGDEKGYTNTTPATYVIEINGGTARKLGVKEGDTVTLPQDLPAAR